MEVIRIGSRVPAFLPQRITPELVEMLKQFHPLWMNVHFNHPKEITPEVEKVLALLANAGIPLGSQSVLLAGVNDCPNIMKDLVHKLVRNRVRPYYLYQCDLVHGAGHFRTPVSVGLQIMESLRGHTSGFAIPTYVIDAPAGGGKIPILPNYVLSQSPDRVVVRNYEGFISAYAQPDVYRRHDAATCPACRQQQAAAEGAQEGVSALLRGAALAIRPEGFETAHKKGGRDSRAGPGRGHGPGAGQVERQRPQARSRAGPGRRHRANAGQIKRQRQRPQEIIARRHEGWNPRNPIIFVSFVPFVVRSFSKE